ncbi:MAG: hypothetical protein QOJ65_2033 [Fimbriimonadaceae bacterium]|nr:hypothetical protein [Fimbriimonadaceae bacterium]
MPAAPAMTPDMAAKIALASQQYGETKPVNTGAQQNSVRGLYLTPTDDVWVYAHAEDPQKDPFLRAWGNGGTFMGLPGDDPNAYSWSLLTWDLSGFPAGSKVVEAELILTAAPESGYTAKDAGEAPLEVRAVKSGFNEKDWDYASATKYAPSAEVVFNRVSPANVSDTEFPIVIDLLKGPADFRNYFSDAMKKNKVMALSLTSAIDPSKLGMKGVYKVYSKDASDPMVRPRLRLVLEGPKKGK